MKIKSSSTHLVVVQYAYANYDKGDVISQHKSYELARKAAGDNSHVRVVDVDDVRGGTAWVNAKFA